MKTEPFDASSYTRAPVITVAGGLTLCDMLVSSCPKGAPAHVKKSSKKLQEAAASVRAAWTGQYHELGQVPEVDSRALDQEADTSYSALRMRVAACALLPATRYPLAPKAEKINARLFPEGLEFLKRPYPIQLAEMKRVVQCIDDEGLQAEIDAIAGPEYLQQIRHVVPRYEAMVKAMFQREQAQMTMADHTRLLQRAIVDYASKVISMIDEDEPETITAVRAALRPIDTYREMFPRAANGAKDGAAPQPAAGQPNAPGGVAKGEATDGANGADTAPAGGEADVVIADGGTGLEPGEGATPLPPGGPNGAPAKGGAGKSRPA